MALNDSLSLFILYFFLLPRRCRCSLIIAFSPKTHKCNALVFSSVIHQLILKFYTFDSFFCHIAASSIR